MCLTFLLEAGQLPEISTFLCILAVVQIVLKL